MIRRQKLLSLHIPKTHNFLSHQHLYFSLHGRHRHRTNYDENKNIRDLKQPKEGQIQYFKSLGQHILTNPRILDAIVNKSGIRSTDTVLEIGPGTGNLTMRLLEAAERVVAVEVDKRMVEVLNARVSGSRFGERIDLICKDALKVDYPRFDLVVANIPYNISSPLIAKIVFGSNPFRSATLLLQKEFAQRLLANPGDSEYNRLAVNVKLVADVEFIMNVSKRDFVPNPKVDSSVVKIWPKAKIPKLDLCEWWAFTRTCFSKKNKTLGATFKQKKKVLELYRLSKMMESKVKFAQASISTYASRIYPLETSLETREILCTSDPLISCNPGIVNTELPLCGEDDDDDGENCSLFSCSDTGLDQFREKVIGVLRLGGFEDKRPLKLCNEELLSLLCSFNQAGICFHDHEKSKGVNNEFFAAAFTP